MLNADDPAKRWDTLLFEPVTGSIGDTADKRHLRLQAGNLMKISDKTYAYFPDVKYQKFIS